MTKRKSKQSRFQIARGFPSETALEHMLGTGDIDRATRPIRLQQPTTATTNESEIIAATTTEAVAEEGLTPTEEMRGVVGMTYPDLIDKWLRHWEWLLYVGGPFVLYAIAVASGNLKNESEFIWTTAAGVTVMVLILIIKKLAKAS